MSISSISTRYSEEGITSLLDGESRRVESELSRLTRDPDPSSRSSLIPYGEDRFSDTLCGDCPDGIQIWIICWRSPRDGYDRRITTRHRVSSISIRDGKYRRVSEIRRNVGDPSWDLSHRSSDSIGELCIPSSLISDRDDSCTSRFPDDGIVHRRGWGTRIGWE